MLLPLPWPSESCAARKQKHDNKNTRYVGDCRKQAKRARGVELQPRIGRVELARPMGANRTLPSFWTLGTASASAEEAQTFVEDRMV
jgi:hypothetical protein